MFPPFLHEDAAERRASVTSESSNPPVPVEITMAHFPMAARRTWCDRLGFHSSEAIGNFFVSDSSSFSSSSFSSPSPPAVDPVPTTSIKSQLLTNRPVCTSHNLTTPSSPPLAKNCPSGLIAKHRTITPSVRPGTTYCTHLVVGNGRKSLARGSCGTKLSGSMFSLRFIARGHRYRSRHRSNRSFTECSYAPTDRRLANFRGTKCP
mmetsp:Transcript_35481/g.60307  ORF Transcript_35481/g.60307 Transcript_35481/m.60307 type:complete len:206 (+) Transcript_35481:924-1541(+)